MARLTLGSDYGAGWPLWSDAGEADPAAYGLPADLCADLRAWQELFDAGFDPDAGWRDGATEREYAHAAIDLLRRVRSQLGTDVAVTLDAWPVVNPSLATWIEHRTRHDSAAP